MLRNKYSFGNGYCKGASISDGYSYRAHISYNDDCSVDVESVGMDAEELTRYFVKIASEPRREVRGCNSKKRLNKIVEEMSNAPLHGFGFITLNSEDTFVESVAEDGRLTYTVMFDGSSSRYIYRVEDKKRDEFVNIVLSSVLPFGFSDLIDALGIADK